MGIFSGLGGAYAASKAKNPYKPNKRIPRNLEEWGYQDIRSLYRDTPAPGAEYAGAGYEGPGLGYSEAELEGQFGEGRDAIAGEYAGEQQRTADRFRSPGGLGIQSAQYARAQQRSDLARVARANELKRRMVVENAQQKRADKMARIAATTGFYGQEVDLLNNYLTGKNKSKRDFWTNAGGAVDSAISYGAYS